MMAEIKMLIVEDQSIIRNGLAAIFQLEKDFTVLGTAENGQEALDFIADYHPTLVLMDIHMPVLNGIEACRIISQRFPEIKVIVLTTFADDDYIWEALKAGAVGYILKDMETDQMIRIIKDCLAGRISFPSAIQKKLQHAASLTHHASSNEVGVGHLIEYNLTQREMDVALMLMEGKTNREIADGLCLSEGTIKNYLISIYQKMNVTKRTEAVIKLRSL